MNSVRTIFVGLAFQQDPKFEAFNPPKFPHYSFQKTARWHLVSVQSLDDGGRGNEQLCGPQIRAGPFKGFWVLDFLGFQGFRV